MAEPERQLFVFEERQTKAQVLQKWLLRCAVALLFASVGSNKFGEHRMWIDIFNRIGLGQWCRYFTGVLQVLGALLVLIPRTFTVGSIMLACTMLGAAAAWIFILGEPVNAMIPGLLLGGLLAIGGESLMDLFTAAKRK